MLAQRSRPERLTDEHERLGVKKGNAFRHGDGAGDRAVLNEHVVDLDPIQTGVDAKRPDSM